VPDAAGTGPGFNVSCRGCGSAADESRRPLEYTRRGARRHTDYKPNRPTVPATAEDPGRSLSFGFPRLAYHYVLSRRSCACHWRYGRRRYKFLDSRVDRADFAVRERSGTRDGCRTLTWVIWRSLWARMERKAIDKRGGLIARSRMHRRSR